MFIGADKARFTIGITIGNLHPEVTGIISCIKANPCEEVAVIARILSPDELVSYVVSKGFIAVDGVSLTVIDYDEISFSVSLVAYTRKHTTLGMRKAGDIVNLEVDIIAKYIEQLSQTRHTGITVDFLQEHGFLVS